MSHKKVVEDYAKPLVIADYKANNGNGRRGLYEARVPWGNEMRTVRLCVDVYYDFYEFQSHAKVDYWNGSEWAPVWSEPYALLKRVLDVDTRTLLRNALIALGHNNDFEQLDK